MRKSRITSTTASNSHWSNFSNYRYSFPICYPSIGCFPSFEFYLQTCPNTRLYSKGARSPQATNIWSRLKKNTGRPSGHPALLLLVQRVTIYIKRYSSYMQISAIRLQCVNKHVLVDKISIAMTC